jgi:triacylglycerol esterase/lipase EstA (alpha/beta hydrolase family)
MRAGELEAIGKLGGTAISHPATTVRDVHRAVAGRVFGALGVLGAPVRLMHDGIARTAYGATRAALGAPLGAAGRALARAVAPDAPSLAESPLGSAALSALNGMWGDRIARDHPDLALDMSIHDDGLDPTPRLAIFVHGLCETDGSWRGVYGGRLRRELGYTPMYVRYNTGLHVSDNGRRLAELIDDVVQGWPVPVTDVALVGHSMGGLVARSACHYAQAGDRGWTERLRHVFCLGTPHLGAPLERAANRAGWALSRLPETQPFAAAVNARSAGIKDMRFGNCVEEDWCDCDPDEYLRDRCNEVPFLPTATYCFVGATLTRAPDGRLANLVGDLLVQFPSASGNGPTRRIPFAVDNGRHVGGLNHFQLLTHPAVYEQLRAWLSPENATLALAIPASGA